MATVHVHNTVRDFDAWKENFDKHERFRAEQGVQSYRMSRGVTEPNDVLVDLEFTDEATAQAFLPQLAQIMDAPQTKDLVVHHQPPQLYTLITERVPTATATH